MLTFPDLPPPDVIPKIEPVSAVKPNTNEFDFNILPTLPSNNGLGNLDLGNINMNDFAAMIANSGFDYASTGNQPNQQVQTIPIQTIQSQNRNQSTIQPSPIAVNNPITTNNASREQSDTDRLLAQLGAFTGSGPSNTVDQTQIRVQPQQQQQPTSSAVNPLKEDEVDALLASLNDNNGNGDTNVTDFTNFDFGDIDLSNLGDMSGLFNTSTAPTATSNLQGQNQQMPNLTTITQPVGIVSTQVQAQSQNPPAVIKQEPSIPAPEVINPVDPNLDMSNMFDESQPIDLDDFNFGNGDEGVGEGGIDLTGDEFENLLAAFN
jgi:hypothetical protein